MQNTTTFTDSFPQFTARSEKTLLYRVLDESVFASKTVERLLALYPSSKESEKASIICKVMEELWRSAKLFKSFHAFDFFLATSGKRGHFVHQFEVFMLGVNILLYLKEKSPDFYKIADFNNFDEIVFAWLLTAGSHDFGYPVEDAHKILEKISGLYEDFELPHLSEKFNLAKVKNIVEKEGGLTKVLLPATEAKIGHFIDIRTIVRGSIMKSLDVSLQEAMKLEESFIEKSRHGYIGALLVTRTVISDLLSSNEITADKIENIYHLLNYRAISKASGAIALHNLSPKNDGELAYIQKLSLENNMLAYLLFVVDNVQDWNRNLFPDDEYPEYRLEKVRLDEMGIHLNYYIVHKDWATDKIKDTVDSFISEKRICLNNLPSPVDKFNFTLTLNFHRSDGFTYENITISL